MYFLLVDPCHGYRTFNTTDRNLAHADKSHSDDCATFPTDWYRFEGDVGTRLPTECPSKRSEPYPVWLNVESNRLPYKGEGLKKIKPCHPTKDQNCCRPKYSHVEISVKNCSLYLVYNLYKIQACPYRYYGTN